MKRIEAIVRPGKLNDILSALEKVGHPGMMITEIEGHGKQSGVEQQSRGKTYRVDLLTKSRIVIVTKDPDVAMIVETIRKAAYTGKVGDGKIFISSIEDVVRIRTDEKGEAAI